MIREFFYPDWLENVVKVKKSNDKWRMCVDFIDLNKVCLKNSFPRRFDEGIENQNSTPNF